MIAIEELYQIYLAHPVVQTDTRKLTPGAIYFALKGENFNGNLFAQDAISKGASYAVVDDPSLSEEPNCLYVFDVLATLQQLALLHRKTLKIPILAITGSNGKTTTKELITAVIAQKFKTLSTNGNYNNHIGVPLTLLRIQKTHEFAVIEMGANHQREIASYCEWARPDFALINNCGKAHLEGFGGIEGVRKGKGELYDFIRSHGGTIFINSDLDYLKDMANGIEQQISYGEFTGETRGKIYEHEPFLKIALTNHGEERIIATNLIGDYNLPNVLAAVAIGKYFGVSKNEIDRAITNYFPTNNRSEHRIINDIHFILDAYNANPTSMVAAIRSFQQLDQRLKVLVLGSMMELGDESENEHRSVLKFAKQFSWEKIITVGEGFKEQSNLLGIQHFDNADDLRDWFWKHIDKDAWVLLKGSRLTAMEKLISNA